MSDRDEYMERAPFNIASIEFDPMDGLVTVTIIDDTRASRPNGVLPEVRQVRLDGQKWSEHVEEILGDITELLVEVQRAGEPMTRPSRGRDDAAE